MKSQRIREAFTKIVSEGRPYGVEGKYEGEASKEVRDRAAGLAKRARKGGNTKRAQKISGLVRKGGWESPTRTKEPREIE